MSTFQNALTGHLVLSSNITDLQIHQIKHDLKYSFDHKNIQHVTPETENESCEAVYCRLFDFT